MTAVGAAADCAVAVIPQAESLWWHGGAGGGASGLESDVRAELGAVMVSR